MEEILGLLPKEFFTPERFEKAGVREKIYRTKIEFAISCWYEYGNRNYRIRTMEDVVSHREVEWLRQHAVGKKTVDALKKLLGTAGLTLHCAE